MEGIFHTEGFENGGQLLARCLPSLRPGQAWTPGDVVDAFKREIRHWRRRAYGAPCTAAVERLAVNEIMHSWAWVEARRWRWRRPGHINLLESGVARNWMEGLAASPGPQLVVGISDSQVAL